MAMVKGDDFSYDAFRTPMDLPIAGEVVAAVESAQGKVVKWPTMGVFRLELWNGPRVLTRLRFRLRITTTTSTRRTRIRLQNLWDGIEMMAALMQME